MTKNNKILSDRQVFRTGVLENSAFAMMLAPYVAVKLAGRLHLLALFLGIILFALFGFYIYFISERVYGSYEEVLSFRHGGAGRAACIIYYLRFHFRAALYLLFLGEIVSTYMLVNVNYWLIVISFLLVCFYGASKSIVGRARMLEMLFLWMVVPLILMAVFSVNSVDVTKNPDFAISVFSDMGTGRSLNILAGGYGILLLLQSLELMLFSLDHAVSDSRQSMVKIVVWVGISVFMAYIFIMGILGRSWVVSDPKAAFNVMEAASFPGNAFNRLDYFILAFLMIGVFAAVSGYLFCGRRILECMAHRAESWWRKIILLLTIVVFTALWCVGELRRGLYIYLFFIDFPLGLLLPLVVFGRSRLRDRE